jgi:hypothetical protein
MENDLGMTGNNNIITTNNPNRHQQAKRIKKYGLRWYRKYDMHDVPHRINC